MKEEYKELLLRDLSARLPYGVKVATTNPAVEFGVISGISIERKISVRTKDADIVFECTEIKPYLRPMSSMTEKEKQELLKATSLIEYDEEYETLQSFDFYGDARLDVGMEIWMKAFDWLNKKMFDYRTYKDKDMFELGLAIPAPAGMYE